MFVFHFLHLISSFKLKLVILTIVVLISFCFKCRSQSWGDSTAKNKILFYSFETPPRFPNGTKGFYEFLARNISLFPKEVDILAGKVIQIRIILNDYGKLIFAEIVKGTNTKYDSSLINVIKDMPDWLPAAQNGRTVFASLDIPIFFAGQ